MKSSLTSMLESFDNEDEEMKIMDIINLNKKLGNLANIFYSEIPNVNRPVTKVIWLSFSARPNWMYFTLKRSQ